MFKHNLLIIYRNIKRDKSSFFINLIGLSTGLACAIVIYLWVNDELSVDKFHEKDSQLFQVMENQKNAEGIRTVEWTPGPLAKALAEEIPEVEKAVTVMPYSWFPEFMLSVGEDKTIKAVGQFAGDDYFNMFSYKLFQGNQGQVLSDKNAIVISENLAKRIFGTTENVIGKTIKWQILQFSGQSSISGIFTPPPSNSTEHFDFVLSYEAFKDIIPRFTGNWEASAPSTYVILKKGTDTDQFNSKIAGFVKTKNKDSNVTLFVRQYSNQYLYGNYENGVQSGGRIEYVKLFSLIAMFILIIACINFMNLSTAQASRKMKEVGIKKTVGAGRKVLIFQYLSESVLTTILSLLIALMIVVFLLPQFNNITGKQILLNFDLRLILPILFVTLLTGLFAGSYPAMYLSGFNPVMILAGKLGGSYSKQWIRKGLVLFQFALSAILIVGILVIYKQIEYVQNKNLGYDKNNVIYFPSEGKIAESQEIFLSEIKNIPGIIDASSALHAPMGTYSTTSNLNWPGKEPEDNISFEDFQVNYDMLETLGIKIIAGRSFSKNVNNEESKIILNETAVAVMGLQEPVGKVVKLFGENREIIGVAGDFHFESLYNNIKPLFFILNTNDAVIIAAKIQASGREGTISRLRKFYEGYNPGYLFDYRFLDEDYKELYIAEQRVSVISRYFAGLAILISCLGLFGLAKFTAERRTKEISIRKILGAGEFRIVHLLSNEFIKIVLIAILIAVPASWIFMHNWLENFAYKTTLSWWIFALAGVLALGIALLTVSWQSWRAATRNPVEALRYE